MKCFIFTVEREDCVNGFERDNQTNRERDRGSRWREVGEVFDLNYEMISKSKIILSLFGIHTLF